LRGGVAARRGWGRRRGREGGGAEAGEGRKGLSSPGCDGAPRAWGRGGWHGPRNGCDCSVAVGYATDGARSSS
jgi:hypothetical protein